MSLLLTISVFLSVSTAGSDGDPPASGVTVDRTKVATRLDGMLPGLLLSYALPRAPDGRREVVMLVLPHRPAETGKPDTGADDAASQSGDNGGDYRKIPPCPAEQDDPATAVVARPGLALYRLDVGAERLELLRDDLPHDSTALDAADLDGDGREELILARPGEVLRVDLDPSRPLRTLLEQEGVSWKSLHPRSIRYEHLDDRPWATKLELGRLSLYGPLAGADTWDVLAEVELPLDADVEAGGIRVWSPSPRMVGSGSDGTLYFASPPESFGKSRVHTTLAAVHPDGDPSTTECWGRLPAPEDVLDSSFLFVDDRPVLLVTTKPGDKLNLFGEKRLRIYPLERDRSRLGLLPLFEVQTRMNMWQEADPQMLDVNGDGRDDLVLGYWKGILKDRVVLDAYLRTPDGGFEKSERNTAFDVKKGDRDFVQYGADLTGDGIPDLLVRGKKGLMIYPGRRSKNGRRLVEDDPILVQLTDREKESKDEFLFSYYSGGRPRVVDLDADGTHDILLVYPGDFSRRGILRLVRLAS